MSCKRDGAMRHLSCLSAHPSPACKFQILPRPWTRLFPSTRTNENSFSFRSLREGEEGDQRLAIEI
eukprot:747231-Hanusia_phi.AAC.1